MDDVVPGPQHRALQEKYDNLEKDYKSALDRLHRSKIALVKYRDVLKNWQEWYDKHPRYTTSKKKDEPRSAAQSLKYESPLPVSRSTGGSLAEQLPQLQTTEPRPQAALQEDHEYNISNAEDLPEPGPGQLERLQAEGPVQITTVSHHRSSSQSTQIDPEDLIEQHIKTEPIDDDDEPEVVSARTIRKSRPSSRIQRASGNRGTPSQPYKIKREDTSTSEHMFDVPAFMRTYTQASDLDQSLAHIETPRKRQKLIEFAEEDARTVRATRADKLNGLLRAAKDENTPPSNSQQSRDSQNSTSSRSRSSGGPLHSLSTNTPTLPRTSPRPVKREKLHEDGRDERVADNVHRLAGDDTNFSNPDQQNTKKVRRLENLLQGEGTSKNILTPRALSGSRSPLQRIAPASPSMSNGPRAPATRNTRHKKPSPAAEPTSRRKRPASPLTSSKRARVSHSSPPAPRPEEEPLRARPLHSLVPDDFKINPLYAGTDYAFNAPLRDQASRRCVPGCTRECCASLLRFTTATTPRGRPTSRDTPTTNATEEDEEEDNSTLQAYLGHDPSSLTASQRESLLQSARAQKVANRYGRHKQVFERRRTPPGFWRTEMPSTQEMEEDRRQAKEVEKRVTEERWREAVRGDGKGRWVFRDEVGRGPGR
ncbi:DNA repair protein endonuclease-like protein [Elsinoe australis]|uniref:DNA repair protein endonuclease-like protein n=1 Tax=Elsinoe australis TaxID=40998 RepID=A0A4U7AWQ8_9PEZI|nr:DNA repair protein endonuclease-like protein [Elsinoe australis]